MIYTPQNRESGIFTTENGHEAKMGLVVISFLRARAVLLNIPQEGYTCNFSTQKFKAGLPQV